MHWALLDLKDQLLKQSINNSDDPKSMAFHIPIFASASRTTLTYFVSLTAVYLTPTSFTIPFQNRISSPHGFCSHSLHTS